MYYETITHISVISCFAEIKFYAWGGNSHTLTVFGKMSLKIQLFTLQLQCISWVGILTYIRCDIGVQEGMELAQYLRDPRLSNIPLPRTGTRLSLC